MNDGVPPSSIRTFLLVENRLLREALARLFRKLPDFSVLGQAASSRVLPPELINGEWDVLVGDQFLPSMSSLLAARKSEENPRSIILVDMDAEEGHFLAAVRSGIRGYLLKDVRASDVIAAVRSVFLGSAVCPPQLCSVLFQFAAQSGRDMPAPEAASRPDLTLRQQQLVRLVAQGLTNKEIAAQLHLSQFTVRNHVHRIMKQVDAGSRGEAVANIRAHGYAISL